MDETIKEPGTKEVSKTIMSKMSIIKNVFVMCIGILTLFTAYEGLATLQSTMNQEQGIGVASQAVLCGCFCVSSVLFPKYVITKLGSKRTFVFSMMTYIPYIASNFYPHWILMIPTSILIEIGASLLWGSQATYLNEISVMYADITTNSEKHSFPSFINYQENESEPERKIFCSGSVTFYSSNYQQDEQYVGKKINICTIKCDEDSLRFDSQNKKDKSATISNPQNATDLSSEPRDSYPCNLSTGCIPSYRLKSTEPDATCGNSRKLSLPIANEDRGNVKSACSRKFQGKMKYRSKIVESTTGQFFGFSGMAFLSSTLWSNLISYYVLKNDSVSEHFSNLSGICGADFCNVEERFESYIETPSDSSRYILTGTFTCFGVFSILIVALFLDPLETEKKEVTFTLKLLMATYKIAKTKELLLLIPASLSTGIIQAFYNGDFTKSYIGCAWGTYHIGQVSVCYGFACGISSTLSGWLVKRLGRISIFASAAVVNVVANALLLLWVPDSEKIVIFFLLAAMWGVQVGFVWSQLRAFYGILFKANEEAAFSAFNVWYSMGLCLSYAYSNYFCTFVKIYVILIVSSLGFVGYLCVEKLQKKK